MKIGIKLLSVAILSVLMGIVAASPLLVSELNIRPWITHVQGPTAEFTVEVVYANFTLLSADKPITRDSGPTISYFAIVNVTNPSDLPASLHEVSFVAAEKIANATGKNPFGSGNWTRGEGWEAKGAWVDGVWYNVTWTDNSYPYFDPNGTMTESQFKPPVEGHWMEGVQIYDRSVNGTLVATYLNMNGTWTDVTGRITVTRPIHGGGYSITNVVADVMHTFENVAVREYTSDGTALGSSFGAMKFIHHLVGEGLFDNYWGPHESRLVVISGSWDARKPYDEKTVKALQSGSLMFKTRVMSSIDEAASMMNNTVTDTWSYTTEIEQVKLTKSGNNYVYSTSAMLKDDQMFQVDQWGVEAFIKSGR